MTATETIPALSHQHWQYERPQPGGIVVGIDGSPQSLVALDTAAAIAMREKLAVHAVGVIPPISSYHINPGAVSSQKNIDDLRIGLKNEQLAEIVENIDQALKPTYQCVIGAPANSLVRTAQSRQADLIIVGRHAHGVIDRALGNETTLHVMRTSSVPVLAVDKQTGLPRKVVAAVDFSVASIEAVKAALRIMRTDGTLDLCYVTPPLELMPEGFAVPYDDSLTNDITNAFAHLTNRLRIPSGIRVQRTVLTGRTADCVIEHAERVGADMIAIGSHRHSAIGRIFLGSVSTSITTRASCAVLVSPPMERSPLIK